MPVFTVICQPEEVAESIQLLERTAWMVHHTMRINLADDCRSSQPIEPSEYMQQRPASEACPKPIRPCVMRVDESAGLFQVRYAYKSILPLHWCVRAGIQNCPDPVRNNGWFHQSRSLTVWQVSRCSSTLYVHAGGISGGTG